MSATEPAAEHVRTVLHRTLDRLGGSPGPATDPAAEHVRKVLEQLLVRIDAIRNKVGALESTGHRIVGGGQTGIPDDYGRSNWEVTDWRTRTILLRGHGTFEDYELAISEQAPDGKWIHIDGLMEEFELAYVEPTPGLPPSLEAVLQDWADGGGEAEEVAAFTGWNLDTVRLAQATDSDLGSMI